MLKSDMPIGTDVGIFVYNYDTSLWCFDCCCCCCRYQRKLKAATAMAYGKNFANLQSWNSLCSFWNSINKMTTFLALKAILLKHSELNIFFFCQAKNHTL